MIFIYLQKNDVCVFNRTGENTSSYLSKNTLAFREQNVLLGTTYRIIANALSSEPTCLAEIEESKARRIVELSGSSSDNAEKVVNSERRSFLYLCVVYLDMQPSGYMKEIMKNDDCLCF